MSEIQTREIRTFVISDFRHLDVSKNHHTLGLHFSQCLTFELKVWLSDTFWKKMWLKLFCLETEQYWVYEINICLDIRHSMYIENEREYWIANKIFKEQISCAFPARNDPGNHEVDYSFKSFYMIQRTFKYLTCSVFEEVGCVRFVVFTDPNLLNSERQYIHKFTIFLLV